MRIFLALVVSLTLTGISFAKNNIFAPPSIVIKKPETETIVKTNNPLQKYSLEAYKLTGIVVSAGMKKAMIVAPDRKTYFVKVGDYLGNRGERIIGIEPNGLVLSWKGKIILLPLKKK